MEKALANAMEKVLKEDIVLLTWTCANSEQMNQTESSTTVSANGERIGDKDANS